MSPRGCYVSKNEIRTNYYPMVNKDLVHEPRISGDNPWIRGNEGIPSESVVDFPEEMMREKKCQETLVG